LFQIQQRRARQKRGLRVRAISRRFKTVEEGRAELDKRENSKPVRVLVHAWRRGIFALPEFVLETYYPIGLFRAWKVFRPQGQVVVYPKPGGHRHLQPLHFDRGQEDLGLRTSPEGDFGELKPYQEGESYHQIAWKHYARTGQLYSKVHWGQDNRFYQIPWDPHGQKLEDYLKQMSAWVRQALDENATFEMETPGAKIPAGSGTDQARACWRALAGVKAG
jgi:uncharacterized protein (DUF58 family)